MQRKKNFPASPLAGEHSFSGLLRCKVNLLMPGELTPPVNGAFLKWRPYCLPISVTKALWRQRRMAGEVYSSREEHVWPQKLRHPEMRTS